MDFIELAAARRSVRSYKPDPIPEDLLLRILNAGRLAPSAWNSQPWKFIIVRERAARAAVAALCPSKTRVQSFIEEAPVVIVAVATETDRVMSSGITSWPIDMAIAVDHITLAAAAEGLGTCWIGSFDQDALRDLLGIPSNMMIAAVLPLGYPADGPKSKKRKSLDEILCWERFE